VIKAMRTVSVVFFLVFFFRFGHVRTAEVARFGTEHLDGGE
jgi:hypothetical protein